MLLFHQSTVRIKEYTAFDKYFYSCDVVIEKLCTLYFYFIKKSSLHSNPCIMKHNE